MFEHGVVVGKFAPLHRGHEHLIRCALQQCRQLTIISYSKPEFPGFEAARRRHWLHALFPQANVLVFDEAEVQSWRTHGWKLRLPDNAAPDIRQREFVAELLWQRALHDVDAVFSSESYGDGFASYLQQFLTRQLQRRHTVQHICVDPAREQVPVSGRQIRQDIHAARQWLAPVVYADFVTRVCLLGGESSGKSTLAKALAQQFCTQWVPEFGRYWWLLNNGELQADDYLHIARQQRQLETLAAGQAHRYLFCDTGPLTTLGYYQDQFGKPHPGLLQAALQPYGLILLLKNDFDFVQDGSRRDLAFSARQFAWYEAFLQQHGVHYETLAGSLPERLAQVSRLLSPAPSASQA